MRVPQIRLEGPERTSGALLLPRFSGPPRGSREKSEKTTFYLYEVKVESRFSRNETNRSQVQKQSLLLVYPNVRLSACNNHLVSFIIAHDYQAILSWENSILDIRVLLHGYFLHEYMFFFQKSSSRGITSSNV